MYTEIAHGELKAAGGCPQQLQIPKGWRAHGDLRHFTNLPGKQTSLGIHHAALLEKEQGSRSLNSIIFVFLHVNRRPFIFCVIYVFCCLVPFSFPLSILISFSSHIFVLSHPSQSHSSLLPFLSLVPNFRLITTGTQRMHASVDYGMLLASYKTSSLWLCMYAHHQSSGRVYILFVKIQ